MEILEVYKRERPDIFARLPLPKDIAEKMGCPIKDDIIHLNDYLKAFLATRTEPYQEFEEKVAVELIPGPEPEKPKQIQLIEQYDAIWKNALSNLSKKPEDSEDSKEASVPRILELKDLTFSNLLSSLNDEKCKTLSV